MNNSKQDILNNLIKKKPSSIAYPCCTDRPFVWNQANRSIKELDFRRLPDEEIRPTEKILREQKRKPKRHYPCRRIWYADGSD